MEVNNLHQQFAFQMFGLTREFGKQIAAVEKLNLSVSD
jgi:hypothetical protein